VRRKILTNWKTIDTAPKDGTRIIGYSHNNVYCCEWYEFSWFDGDWEVGEPKYWTEFNPPDALTPDKQ